MVMKDRQRRAMFAKINAKFISTPSHGYLVVNTRDFKKVNSPITEFSPKNKMVVFLEEDVDANAFIRNAKSKGIKLNIENFRTENNNFPFTIGKKFKKIRPAQ